jgi:hypothetical protein
MTALVAQNIDFSVKWNWNVGSSENSLSEASTLSQINAIACTLTSVQDSNIPSAAGYTTIGTSSLSTTSGVALSGTTFFSALSANSVDPFYPEVNGVYDSSDLEMVDTCLGHPQETGWYHYHTMSPCHTSSADSATVIGCAASSSCSASIKAYAVAGFSSYKTLTPIGIAKDGHIIWGPYNSAGSLWGGCDVDICNGAWVGGSYGYVATQFHPYLPMCWGPGSNTTISQTCSTNAKTCDGYVQKVISYVLTVALVSYTVLF